jgi:hypothetical protein
MPSKLHKLIGPGPFAMALLLATAESHADWSDMPPELRGQLVAATAQVGRVWPDDAALLEFHATSAKRFKDTPPIEHFRSQEAWLSVFTARSVRYPGVFVVRSESTNGLARGDIVRVSLVNFRKIDSYFQLNKVESVLCRASAPDYAECAKTNPLSWTLKSGQTISR